MTPSPTSTRARAAAELRRAFLDFFVARGHTAVPSAPLVPDDPTLLFTTAGMVQFKPYYAARGEVPFTRAVSVQKCLRLTDLDQVGTTPRHCTFFEMLGNFSFGAPERGAYFKQDAIVFAWEFVTQVLGLPRHRLYVSIFEGEGTLPRDDEAEALWKSVGMPADHIVALGRADNFWGPAGGRGACGPCSEIYFDLGEKRPASLPAGAFWGERPGDPGDRYMEFWNLVFPQFDAQVDGSLIPLARPGIDTGMGLERLALVVQEKTSVFETDAFTPLVEKVLALKRERSGQPGARELLDARVIADHARALTFAIADGVAPSSTDDRGSLLRKLVNRMVARGGNPRGLRITGEFLSACAEAVIDAYGHHYHELRAHQATIQTLLDREERKAADASSGGRQRLERLLAAGRDSVSAEEAFLLHATFGYSIEEIVSDAADLGARVDVEGFERAMEAHRALARGASKFERAGEGEAGLPWTEVTAGEDSEFVGYQTLRADGVTLRRLRSHGDDELELVLDRTPFYAEGGGQVADRGRIEAIGIVAELTHVYREGESIVHRVRLANGGREGLVSAGTRGGLKAAVDPRIRYPTMRHHTATHLLHATLRHVLGAQVRQAGSLVAPDRLRFDYTHFEAPTEEQRAAIERRVVEWVLRNRDVSWEVMPLDQAKQAGAMALFGEKYGAEVRVVTVAGVDDAGIAPSRELCGGTHVRRTGDIGAFVLVSDTPIASGVRRIEALCGHVALDYLEGRAAALEHAAELLQVRPEAVPEQIEKLKGEIERLRKAQHESRRGSLEAEMRRIAAQAVTAPQGRWAVEEIRVEADAGALREAADRLRGTLERGAAVLAIQGAGKLTFLAAVTDDLVAEKKLSADQLVRAVAQVTGGSGGGKPHLALAGGKDPAKLGAALDEARRLLTAALGA